MHSGPITLRLMTYNICNGFDGFDDPELDDGPAKSPESLEAVASVIQAANPDVIALQEVENDSVLDDLAAYHQLSRKFPHRALISGGDRRGLDVALLSRYPISTSKLHSERIVGWRGKMPVRSRRGLLQCDIQLPLGKTLRVFVNHLPCLRDDARKSERLQFEEATTFREIITEQSQSYPAHFQVVMGDFNSLEGSRVLDLLTEHKRYPRLVNTSANLPPSYGHRFDDPGHWLSNRIDHILCDTELARHVVSSETFRHPVEKMASDHLPVITDFQLPGPQAA